VNGSEANRAEVIQGFDHLRGHAYRGAYPRLGCTGALAECPAMKLSVSTVLVVSLIALLVWFGSALVRVENQRYALQVGLCTFSPTDPVVLSDCLNRAETRTGWWWHIFYALRG
jgi:hypothetical protein